MNAAQTWLPYCGAAPAPAELLGRWNLDPLLIAALLALGWAYRSQFGSLAPGRQRRFYAALALMALLFVSPLCALSSALFSSRVVHHVFLTAVVAPLLVASLPRAPRLPGGPMLWTGLQAAVFWAWHAPPAYTWALSSDPVYWLMQLMLLGTAVGFWAAVRRTEAPVAAIALFATMVQMGALGALITFAARPLYAPHLFAPVPWGVTPLEDQQIAGLIMWVPAAALYLGAALLLVGRWLSREPRAGAAT